MYFVPSRRDRQARREARRCEARRQDGRRAVRVRRVVAPRPVIGLDLSLTAPAACRIPVGWEIGDWSALEVAAWQPPAPAGPDDLDGLYRRLSWITSAVSEFCARRTRPVVAIESYAFAARSSSVTKLAELGGCVRVILWQSGIVARPITASSARKLLLGKLPRKGAKDAAQLALWGAGCPKSWSGDVLDALTIANLQLSDLGAPALTLA